MQVGSRAGSASAESYRRLVRGACGDLPGARGYHLNVWHPSNRVLVAAQDRGRWPTPAGQIPQRASRRGMARAGTRGDGRGRTERRRPSAAFLPIVPGSALRPIPAPPRRQVNSTGDSRSKGDARARGRGRTAGTATSKQGAGVRCTRRTGPLRQLANCACGARDLSWPIGRSPRSGRGGSSARRSRRAPARTAAPRRSSPP